MSYQFAHIEFYSRKSTGKKLSVHQILSEARRDAGACPHVENPQAPTLVYGMSLDDLESHHNQQADQATTTNNKGQTRKIRKDQQTMACVVLSYPSDGEDYNLWEDKSLEWLKGKYGDALRSVVLHRDEAHPHLHCYIMPDDMKASSLNEGKRAKDACMQENKGLDTKDANKLGDRAYRSAMRAWQDSYWDAVGLPLGLSRIGPGKRRLSRDAWKAEQHQMKCLQRIKDKGQEYGQKKKEEIIKECIYIKEKILRNHDEKIKEFNQEIDTKKSELKEISHRLIEEENKLKKITSQSLIKRIYNRIFNQGYQKGIEETKVKYMTTIDDLKKNIENLKVDLQASESVSQKYHNIMMSNIKEKEELTKTNKRLQEDNNRLHDDVNSLQDEINRLSVHQSDNKLKI